YKGVLYLGGIVVGNTVYIIEFNARWGDPEVEILAPGITTDFYSISEAIAQENLSNLKIKTDKKCRVVVAACSKGYPIDYSAVRGKQIFGIDEVLKLKGVKLYGAGVKKEGKN